MLTRRRGHAATAAALGAGLALLAASRVWQAGGATAPTGQPTGRTGGDLLPWLPALALVALAGAGALLATGGGLRAFVGALLALCGAGLTAGAVLAVVDGASPWWPALVLAGGLAVADAGVLTLRRGRGWPAMSARYGRAAPEVTSAPASMWDALDRGEDPTR